ncbi:MAG: hypothetical protein RQ982_05630 [Gammaproteobacteria bacterium]|nr:hypothetical protein [Gammaproteobacteria bacterium]
MKKTSLTSTIYIGTFCVAFAGFVFLKIDSVKNPHIEVEVSSSNGVKSEGSENKLSIITDANKTEKIRVFSKDKHGHDIQLVDNTVSSSETTNKYFAARSINNGSYHDISGMQIATSNAQSESNTIQYDYTDSVESEQRNTVTSGYDSTLSVTAVNANSSVTTTVSYPASSGTTASVTETSGAETVDGFTQISSDGSEFLPDGSSQEDLANAQSKDPRVYTIKDYQKVSINCDDRQDGQSERADLIYKLKGC